MRVVVLGGGVIGITSAYYLIKDGHEVDIVERRAEVAVETSWGNGAILHPSSVQPWAAPGVPRKILGWIGDENAPFLLRARAIPRMWRWGLAFLRNCNDDRFRANAIHNLELALESLARLAEIREDTGIAYDAREQAVLKIASDDASLAHMEAEHRWLEAHGLEVTALDRQGCIEQEPALANAAEPIHGGLFFPQDELGDCNKFASGLADWCTERGVRLHLDTTVDRLEVERAAVRAVHTSRDRLPADAVVVALGSWTPLLLRKVGLDAPIYPVKGVSVTAPRAYWNDAPRTAILSEKGKFAVTPIGDRVRVVGTAEIAGYDTTPDAARVQAVLDNAVALFPPLARCVRAPEAKVWAGLRPVTPNARPITGPTAIGGLYVNSGHGHTGWTMACASAKRLADAVAGRGQGADAAGGLARAA